MATPLFTIDRPDAIDDVGTLSSLHGVTVKECGSGAIRQTVVTFEDTPLTITDALAYLGTKFYEFPAGVIAILGSQGAINLTTTSALASTLNSGATISFGVGSATASNITLATTMIDVMPGSGQTVPTFAASTTVDVAGTTGRSKLIGATTAGCLPILDGQSSAKSLFLNLAVPTNTEIDADATVLLNGTITITWVNMGVA